MEHVRKVRVDDHLVWTEWRPARVGLLGFHSDARYRQNHDDHLVERTARGVLRPIQWALLVDDVMEEPRGRNCCDIAVEDLARARRT